MSIRIFDNPISCCSPIIRLPRVVISKNASSFARQSSDFNFSTLAVAKTQRDGQDQQQEVKGISQVIFIRRYSISLIQLILEETVNILLQIIWENYTLVTAASLPIFSWLPAFYKVRSNERLINLHQVCRNDAKKAGNSQVHCISVLQNMATYL